MAAWQEYLRESRRFWEVAEAADDSTHVNQAVSNAVHAVIAANGAVCLFFRGSRPTGDDHGEAAKALRQACKGSRWEAEAARRSRQLSHVVEHKTAAQYLGKPMSAEAGAQAMRQAGRFLEWVESVLPPVGG